MRKRISQWGARTAKGFKDLWEWTKSKGNNAQDRFSDIPLSIRNLVVVAIVTTFGVAIQSEPEKPIQKTIFENLESIALGSAGIIFLLEAKDRQKRDHYEAWQVINSAMGKTGNGGRIQALQDLNKDRVDLGGVAAPQADLSGIQLKQAHLPRAKLELAQLDGANLHRAILTRADLKGANLRGADLTMADLTGANLLGANLTGAVLYKATLTGADFSGANLRGAVLTGAVLYKVNFRYIQLDGCTFWPHPSEVAQAKNIPEELKQQLGIPDTPSPNP